MCINSVAATCNVMVITDPTGKDPNGGAASIPITSIPSPFASMELVRNAFE